MQSSLKTVLQLLRNYLLSKSSNAKVNIFAPLSRRAVRTKYGVVGFIIWIRIVFTNTIPTGRILCSPEFSLGSITHPCWLSALIVRNMASLIPPSSWVELLKEKLDFILPQKLPTGWESNPQSSPVTIIKLGMSIEIRIRELQSQITYTYIRQTLRDLHST